MTDMSTLARIPKRALTLVFVTALLPRLWAIDWAMPLKRAHIDEAVVLFYSLRVVSGDPNPQIFFDYPAFFLYAVAALFKGVLAVARLAGQGAPSAGEALSVYMRGDGLLYLLGAARLLNVFLGAVTAVLIARFGGARWGVFSGLTAALLWALNPLALRHAHYATVDMPAVFLFFLSVERLVSYWEKGRRIDGLWCAFFIGLAAATKYYPAALLVFLSPAPLFQKDKPMVFIFPALSAAVFLAASPYTLLESDAFGGRFFHLLPKIVAGGGVPFLSTFRGLTSNVGFLTCITAVAGFFLAWRSGSRGDRVFTAVFLFFLLFFGLWSVQSAHYTLFLYPLLFLAVGRALRSVSTRVNASAAVCAAALLLALSLPGMFGTLRLLSETDTRLQALAWARETFPPGCRILRFSHTPEFTPRDPFLVTVDWENSRLEDGTDSFSAEGFDFLIYGAFGPSDPRPAALAARFPLMKSFEEPGPDFPHHPSVYVFRLEGRS